MDIVKSKAENSSPAIPIGKTVTPVFKNTFQKQQEKTKNLCIPGTVLEVATNAGRKTKHPCRFFQVVGKQYLKRR